MAAALFPKAGAVILTGLDNPRAATLDLMKLAVTESLDRSSVYQASAADEAQRIAKEVTTADGLICVTGSLYLVGEVQQALKRAAPAIAHQRV
jgi:dihydrofolate synthase/folylpolyglutamate synthase